MYIYLFILFIQHLYSALFTNKYALYMTTLHTKISTKRLLFLVHRPYLKVILLKYGGKMCTFQKYVIGNIYRCHRIMLKIYLSAFTNEYSDLPNRLRTRSKFIYMCGDYNIDILNMCSNNNYNTFY